MKKSILTSIEESFLSRYRQRQFSLDLWQSIMEAWPPALETGSRPSLVMARRSGDAGLALLWVVQAALVRPILQCVADQDTPLLGALCHAEEREDPMIIKRKNGCVLLSGSKRFVSGGPEADLLLVTGRSEPEGKIDWLLALPPEELAPFMKELSLPALNTVPHGRFSVTDFNPERYLETDTDPSLLRRILKTSGLLERSSIVEMVCGLGLYLAEKSGHEKKGETLKKITLEVSQFLNYQLKADMNGEKLPLLPASLLKNVFRLLAGIREGTSEHEPERSSDLEFLLALFERLPSEKSL